MSGKIHGLAASLVMVMLAAASALAAPCPKQAEAQAKYERAMKMFEETHDQATAKKSAALIEEAAALCPQYLEAWTQLSALYWEIGDWQPRENQDDRIAWFAKGEAAADKALALNPDSADGLYWKTTNMASAADMKGWASSLWMFPTLWENMDRVERLEPHYGLGAVDRFWAEVMTRVPLFLAERFGHSVDEVVAALDEEIALAPDYFGNYTYAARLLWKKGEKDKALTYLEFVLSHDPGALPAKKADNLAQQKVARQLWKEYTGKDFPAR